MKRPCKGQMALGKSKGHFILTKLLFCRFSHNCRQKLLKTALHSAKAIHTKIMTKHYSLQCSDKSLFTLQYPWQIFQRMRLLSAKAKCNYQKQTTSCPDRKHLLLQIASLNYALKAYERRYKSKQKAERIYYTSWEFSLTFILSFSLTNCYFHYSDSIEPSCY